MAIDYTRELAEKTPGAADVEEGSDVLGLSADDDIGEAYLTIKRVRPAPKKPARSAISTTTYFPWASKSSASTATTPPGATA